MYAFDWSIGHRRHFLDPWQGLVLKRDMNAVLENVMVALNDDLQFCFNERFGTNTMDWKELDTYETMQDVIAQGSSRFTVGLPLCKTPPSALVKLADSKEAERNNIYGTVSRWQSCTC